MISGRLGVLVDIGLGQRLVAQIQPGELVGEMALISGQHRSATLVAFRDCELVRIPAGAAERLMGSSPQLMFYVLQLLVRRLQETTRRPMLDQAIRTIAFIPLLSEPLTPAATETVRRAFSSVSARLEVLDQDAAAEMPVEELRAIEERSELVVYLSNERDSAWSRRCLRQADRVVFIAAAGSAPDDVARAEVAALKDMHRPTDLVLLNPADASKPTGATAWIDLFPPDHIFHIRRGDAEDHRRIARLATGRAIGIVLSGGGARGFAHVGALKALHDAKIPVDLIGGTSMGALIAASAALDVDVAEVSRKVHHGFVENNPVSDYTVPVIALARGRKMTSLLKHHFGDARVENTWKTFFCVSSNLSTGKVAVHQAGLIWEALRASSAIPGIVPPFIQNGEVLVDGGIMNNFPANIMSSLARGPVVGLEVTLGTPFRAEENDVEGKSLFWMLGSGRRAVPGIFRVLMRAGTVSSDAQTIASRASVDLLIQPDLGPIDMLAFSSFDTAVDIGYRATMDALERLEKPLI